MGHQQGGPLLVELLPTEKVDYQYHNIYFQHYIIEMTPPVPASSAKVFPPKPIKIIAS